MRQEIRKPLAAIGALVTSFIHLTETFEVSNTAMTTCVTNAQWDLKDPEGTEPGKDFAPSMRRYTASVRMSIV